MFQGLLHSSTTKYTDSTLNDHKIALKLLTQNYCILQTTVQTVPKNEESFVILPSFKKFLPLICTQNFDLEQIGKVIRQIINILLNSAMAYGDQIFDFCETESSKRLRRIANPYCHGSSFLFYQASSRDINLISGLWKENK